MSTSCTLFSIPIQGADKPFMIPLLDTPSSHSLRPSLPEFERSSKKYNPSSSMPSKTWIESPLLIVPLRYIPRDHPNIGTNINSSFYFLTKVLILFLMRTKSDNILQWNCRCLKGNNKELCSLITQFFPALVCL